MNQNSVPHDLLDRLAESFVERYRRGERPSLSEYITRHPELAEEIQEVVAALLMMEQIDEDVQPPGRRGDPAGDDADSSNLTTIGDFRIIREVGRGGMGIVYEAEQVSLGRRVALKVLPRQLLAGHKQRKRFEREARAAARLHHTNIVPVFGVGERNGLHYYVMQFIDGLGLDEVIVELRNLRQKESSAGQVTTQPKSPHEDDRPGLEREAAPVPAVAVAQSLLTGQFHRTVLCASGNSDEESAVGPEVSVSITDSSAVPLPALDPPSDTRGAPPDTAVGRLSDTLNVTRTFALPGQSTQTQGSSRRVYWESIARIGTQVGQSLQYAHDQGIIHRDIKPANLLLDIRGTIWVTDFGLAKATDQQDLTHTGDVLGTLRYMAPEQFEGKADGRSDVYALGLTLYELFALRPGFDETDRHKLIKQVTTGTPPRLRTLDPHIPRDLETIVHKAIDREPTHRYQTAQELADDLQRYLGDEPIKAKWVSPVTRFRRWCRRNPAGAAVVVLLLVGFLLSGLASAIFFRQAAANAQLAIANNQLAGQRQRERDVALENLYLADIRLAHEDWKAGNVVRMHDLLDAHRPKSDEPDLRGWEWHYLNSLTRRNVRTLYGHSGPVTCVAWSPNGRRIVSGSVDGSVRIWDAAAAEPMLTLRDEESSDPVLSVAWHPKAKLLATLGLDRRPRIWDSVTGEKVHQLDQLGDTPHLVLAWSPDGTRLATLKTRGRVSVWDAQTWQEEFAAEPIKDLMGAGVITSVAWAPDGIRLAWMYERGTLKVWNTQTNTEILERQWGPRGIRDIIWEPQGKRLATCGRYEQIALWDVENNNTDPVELPGHTASVNSLDWNHRTGQLCSCSDDGTIRVWDVESTKEQMSLRGHMGWVLDVSWSPDGRRLVSAGYDGTVRIWDSIPQGSRALAGGLRVAWHPDGQHVAAVADIDQERRAVSINVSTGEIDRVFSEGFEESVSAIAWSSDGQRLAASSLDGTVHIWESASGIQSLQLATDTQDRDGETRAVCWSPNDRYLATGGWDLLVKVWDAATGEEAFHLKGHQVIIGSVVWSPDGQRIASGSWDGVVKIWDVATRQERFHLRRETRLAPQSLGWQTIWPKVSAGHSADGQSSVIWSHDSQRLYTGSGLGNISVWDMATGRERMRFHAHPSTVRSLALSPDGRRLASSSNDHKVKIWDVASGRELLTLAGTVSHGHGVAWSPDGRALASARGGLEIWDAAPSYAEEVNEAAQ